MELEYVSYAEYPDDPYTKAIFTLLKDKTDLLTFGLKEAKTGGHFWSTASFGVSENGNKRYYSAWETDSKSAASRVTGFIEETVRKLKGAKAPIAQSADVFPNAINEPNQDVLPF